MSSIHGECYDEGMSGRCGKECRLFRRGECEAYDDVIESFGKVSYIDILDIKEKYSNAFGDTNMKRINNEIVDILNKAQQEVLLLTQINAVPWESLKVDTVIKVSSSLEDLNKGKFDIQHFAKFENDVIYHYYNGKTSATDNGSGLVSKLYALPVE